MTTREPGRHRQRFRRPPETVTPYPRPVEPGHVKLAWSNRDHGYDFLIGYQNGQGHWRVLLTPDEVQEMVDHAARIGFTAASARNVASYEEYVVAFRVAWGADADDWYPEKPLGEYAPRLWCAPVDGNSGLRFAGRTLKLATRPGRPENFDPVLDLPVQLNGVTIWWPRCVSVALAAEAQRT